MTTTPRHNFFNTRDANEALDKYEEVFGSAEVFTETTGGSYPPVAEVNFARIIRRAASTRTPMTGAEILDMYYFDYEKGVPY